MIEINNSVFQEEIKLWVSGIQDDDYTLTMDSASLSNLVVPFGNYSHFKINILLPLKWQNFGN